ncbi:MAG: protein-glutamate O-methyltransferase CheR [Magnetococcales bacterium]|nr:protein-glutamate O-methyltransferase CheR [Magnetococcales bacterium]
MDPEKIEEIEIHLLLETLRLRFGYDFHNYAKASLNRRIRSCLASCMLDNIADIIPRLLHEGRFHNRLIAAMTVSVTTMFRDPKIYQGMREKVLPLLKTYPLVNIWHAGCSTGEEVYSMAIMLREEGLLKRVQIYATDLNEIALAKARTGLYSIDSLNEFSENYQKAGGSGLFTDHCRIKGGEVEMDPELCREVMFVRHNLVTDGVFGEMHLILCRNVLIYFDRSLQERVLGLFNESLVSGGFLCLGDKESLDYSDVRNRFKPVVKKLRIFRKRLMHEEDI